MSAYSTAVLANSPFTYYPLNEASATSNALDLSGSGYTAAYASTSMPNAVAGPLAGSGENAPAFIAADDYCVTLPSAFRTAFAAKTAITIEFWVLQNPLTTSAGFIGIGRNGANAYCDIYTPSPNTHTRFEIENSGSSYTTNDWTSPIPNAWTHVAWTLGGSNGKIY